MTTVTSRIAPLIDYLVNLFTNDATLGQALAPNTVTVLDGPQVTEADAFLKLYVGLADPDNQAAELAGDSVQEWAGMGRRGRNEIVTVHCCAEAWSGDNNVQVARDAVMGIVAAVETLMQADSTQFGGNVLFPDPGITSVSLSQNNTSKGAIARAPFDLIFKSRIGG